MMIFSKIYLCRWFMLYLLATCLVWIAGQDARTHRISNRSVLAFGALAAAYRMLCPELSWQAVCVGVFAVSVPLLLAGSMEAGCCWWRRCKINGSRWEFIWCKWNLASVFYWHFAGRNLDNRDAFVQKGETEVEYPAWPVSECGNADFFVLVFLKVMVYNKKMKCELKNWRNMIC